MPQSETFRDFCASQVERLGGAFPDFRFYKPGAVDELVNWLEAKSNGDESRAAGLITEACEFTDLPKISDLNSVWARLHGNPNAKPIASADCQHCAGAGWEEREGTVKSGPFAGEVCTFVARCRCGGMPPGQKIDKVWEAA